MLPSVLYATLAAAILPGQGIPSQGIPGHGGGPEPEPLEALADRHSILHFDVDAQGQHWARGRDYKARVGKDGFAFVPFLGSDAPRNYPVEFRLRSVSRGGVDVPLGGDPKVERKGTQIVLSRGDVDVRYDFESGAVEQSFAVRADGGLGDLVLRLEVTSDLAAQPMDGGFAFTGALGGMTYGAAVALDGHGRVARVPAVLGDGLLTLTVPGSFVDEAAGEVVVDPIMQTFSMDRSPADLGAPDVAYARFTNRFCAVAEERFSASDSDLYSWYIAADGTIEDGAYIDQSTRSFTEPAIATAGGFGSVLIVSEADSLAIPGATDIESRNRDRFGTISFPSQNIQSATTAYSCAAPDLGGDNLSDGLGYRMVYNRDFGTHRDVLTATPYVGASSSTLEGSPLIDSGPPALSRQTGFGILLVAAWAERNLASGESSVQARALNTGSGARVATYEVVPPTAGTFYFDVDASVMSSDNEFVVTYDDRPSNLTDAFVALGDLNGIVDTVELQLAEHADRTPNQNDVQVATGADAFLLGYVEDGELVLSSVTRVGDRIGVVTRRRDRVGSNIVPGSLASAQKMAFSPSVQPAAFVWAESDAMGDRIEGAYVTIPPGLIPAGTPFCYGTSNSTGERGFIQAYGSRLPGPIHNLRASSVPPSSFGYFLASMTMGDVPNAGGSQGTLCVVGSVGRFGIYQADAAGVGRYALDTGQIPRPSGTAAAVSGQTWVFQSWFRDSVSGTATSNFTNGTAIVFR